MRKLKLQVQMSVDGFIAGTNYEMDWVTCPWTDDIKKYVVDITEPVDTILLGKNLAMGFIPHWASQAEGEDVWFVNKMNNSRRVVFSKSLVKLEWENVTLAKGELVEEVKKIKAQDGKDMIAYGGVNFASSLIKANLIDEFHLFVNPVAIGKGLSIFNGLDAKKNFKPVKTQTFDCGITVLNYLPQ
ncbi:MAG: deaminase [Candidatus Amoebophilus sp. 36-38]|nr:MAG: deaminase [Candidatus Amoebophilus sp. 36-38]